MVAAYLHVLQAAAASATGVRLTAMPTVSGLPIDGRGALLDQAQDGRHGVISPCQ